MSLTVQQLLADAKNLSSRLRDRDQSADQLLSRAQEVLKEVDAMRQYQEDVENLNEVAHNRPRAQLVLGKRKTTGKIEFSYSNSAQGSFGCGWLFNSITIHALMMLTKSTCIFANLFVLIWQESNKKIGTFDCYSRKTKS